MKQVTEQTHDLSTPDLSSLEHWLQAVVTNPAGLAGGLASPEARQHIDAAQVEEVLTRSDSLPAAARLGIYAHAYLARLQECLRAEFPTLLHALGEELFTLFTLEYLRHFPSRSYTLNRLGENFPRYLSESRPDADAPSDARESWPDFIVDLARFDRSFAEVFDGPGVEDEQILSRENLIGMSPELLLKASVIPVVCFRLLQFSYPVSQYFAAARRQENPDLPQPAETFVAMNRREYVVRIHELTEPQFQLLQALGGGSTLSQLAHDRSDAEVFLATAREWLAEWAAKGFFSAIVSNDV